MTAQDWFDSFFVQGRYAEQLERVPDERAEQEVSFILEKLNLDEGARVLDLCCGIGRHTIPLARHGFRMAGLDLDAEALKKAKDRAREAGVEITWHQADMRDIPYEGNLDAVISWFTSWGFYERDEDDARVLAAVATALKPGGKFMLEVANRESIFHRYRDTEWREEPDGSLVLTKRELDLASSRNYATEIVIHRDGSRSERWNRVRFYSLTELSRMLTEVGLSIEQTWGGSDGSEYGLASRRLVVLVRKSDSGIEVNR